MIDNRADVVPPLDEPAEFARQQPQGDGFTRTDFLVITGCVVLAALALILYPFV